MIYNYYRAVRDDVLDYIHNEIDYANYETTEELEQYRQKIEQELNELIRHYWKCIRFLLL